MKKRRICCFCERWASGGIESFLHALALRLPMDRLEIDIVAVRMEESLFTAAMEQRGVCFRELSGSLSQLGKNYRMFRRILRERQYDVVHLNLFQGLSLYYALIARQEGVPVRIAHSHNSDLRRSPTRALKLLLHRWGIPYFVSGCILCLNYRLWKAIFRR